MKFNLLLSLAVLTVLALSCGRAKTSPEQDFWKWFQSNENALFDFEKDQAHLFGQLGAEMHKLNPNLTFEFGAKEGSRREFVISAGGIKQAFPEVEALYAAAPSLPRWKFIKFRPRRELMDISYNGMPVKASSVRFLAHRNGQLVDITVFIPGYSQGAQETYAGIAFLLLDQALGEHDVETRIGRVDIDAISKAPPNAGPLESLPKTVDSFLVPKS